jgi:hypothetical protein
MSCKKGKRKERRAGESGQEGGRKERERDCKRERCVAEVLRIGDREYHEMHCRWVNNVHA